MELETSATFGDLTAPDDGRKLDESKREQQQKAEGGKGSAKERRGTGLDWANFVDGLEEAS